MEQIRQVIKKFILENILFEDDENALDYDDSFIEKGIIDSTGVLELVNFIEEEFSVSVDDEEMIPENLDSVNKLAGFVNKKKEN
ncbi:MAG TPA: acyl carrier protein [Nitrospirae bacterium]|nr:acyl carrier protein [bacterium BMS3Bbin09]HDO26251.1 acyl carrier protein [Nitrospirota bacterium]